MDMIDMPQGYVPVLGCKSLFGLEQPTPPLTHFFSEKMYDPLTLMYPSAAYLFLTFIEKNIKTNHVISFKRF